MDLTSMTQDELRFLRASIDVALNAAMECEAPKTIYTRKKECMKEGFWYSTMPPLRNDQILIYELKEMK